MRELFEELKVCMDNLRYCVGMEKSCYRIKGTELDIKQCLERFENEIQYYYYKNLSCLSEKGGQRNKFAEYFDQYRSVKERIILLYIETDWKIFCKKYNTADNEKK